MTLASLGGGRYGEGVRSAIGKKKHQVRGSRNLSFHTLTRMPTSSLSPMHGHVCVCGIRIFVQDSGAGTIPHADNDFGIGHTLDIAVPLCFVSDTPYR
jgi:hypothetical protein